MTTNDNHHLGLPSQQRISHPLCGNGKAKCMRNILERLSSDLFIYSISVRTEKEVHKCYYNDGSCDFRKTENCRHSLTFDLHFYDTRVYVRKTPNSSPKNTFRLQVKSIHPRCWFGV